MNIPPPRPMPQHVPVLTEVIELNEHPQLAPAPVEAVVAPSFPAVTEPQPEAPPIAELPATGGPQADVALQPPPSIIVGTPPLRPAAGLPGASADEAQMAQRVLADVQRQIDGMLEYRLRETLAPILARASEALVRELRQELSKTMRDVVSRAVAQEVVRQRTR